MLEQRAKSKEQRAKSKEQRAKSKEQRAKSNRINISTFKARCQMVLEKICAFCNKISEYETKSSAVIFAISNGDLSSTTCNHLLDASKNLRSLKCENEKLLDEIFSSISSTIEAISQQETKREKLINDLNNELLEHTKLSSS